MTFRIFAAALGALALAACSADGGQNNAAAPPPEEAGDVNTAIGGDELSPIPEAEDDIAANMSGTGNLAAPPPVPAPAPAQNSN